MINLAMAIMMIAHAGVEPVLFRGPGATDFEYRARLGADESLRTPTAAYLAQHPSPAHRELLLARFTRAQSAFLGNSTAEARRHFVEVVALVNADDWRPADREVFLHAYLRLAQLEPSTTDRDHWLAQARFLGPNLRVPADLFPPPLVARYRAGAGRTFTPDVRATGWPLLLINGVACRPGECPAFPTEEGAARVTFLSDQWQPQTVHVDLGALKIRRPPRLDWVAGTCARPALSVAARELSPGRAFFGVACEAGPAPHDRPVLNPELPRITADDQINPAAVTAAPAPRRPLYKSPWLWAGLGAVALTAVVIAVKSSGHHGAPAPPPPPPGPATPTVIYGF